MLVGVQMTWEENKSRDGKPWCGRTLARGLEFSSYAFALGRQWNVEKGKLLDTPAFQWLDAHETTTTVFTVGLHNGAYTVAQALESGRGETTTTTTTTTTTRAK